MPANKEPPDNTNSDKYTDTNSGVQLDPFDLSSLFDFSFFFLLLSQLCSCSRFGFCLSFGRQLLGTRFSGLFFLKPNLLSFGKLLLTRHFCIVCFCFSTTGGANWFEPT